MINKRVSGLSCNEVEFDKAKVAYETALSSSGYDFKMNYEQHNINNTRRNRNRKVIWFNPPFSDSVKTNIGKIFLQLVNRHFPRHHKFHKIFNSNTLKISYSCMTNIGNIIKQHNSNIMRNTPEQQAQPCNCRQRDNCPLNGNCLASCIVYKATVTTGNESKNYFGTSESEFKTRFYNHTKSFRNRSYENDSELSKYLWTLNDRGVGYSIKWDIASKCSPYKCGTRRCDLCLTEKTFILRSDPDLTLNKRSELVSKCRHRSKFLLKNFIY